MPQAQTQSQRALIAPWQLLDQFARIQKGRSLVQAACRRLHLPGTHHSARTAPNVWRFSKISSVKRPILRRQEPARKSSQAISSRTLQDVAAVSALQFAFTSSGERDGEAYHFRPREEIEGLRERENFVVMDMRGDLQALDLDELRGLLGKGDVLLVGSAFRNEPLNETRISVTTS